MSNKKTNRSPDNQNNRKVFIASASGVPLSSVSESSTTKGSSNGSSSSESTQLSMVGEGVGGDGVGGVCDCDRSLLCNLA